MEQGVDAGVAGDSDGRRRDAFAFEIRRGPGGCGEMQGCYAANHLAVGFFRERAGEIPSAEAGFNVGHRHTCV